MIIGPTFSEELEAAGVLTAPIFWSADGVTFDPTITPEVRSKVESVITNHDPARQVVTHAVECTPAQGLMALYQTGHYDAYNKAIEDATYVPLRIYAQSATKWELNNPYIMAMQMELGLSDDQAQALFDLAVTL